MPLALPPDWPRRLRLALLLAIALGCGVPASQALLLRWFNPPFTLTMIGECQSAAGFQRPAYTPIRLQSLPTHVPLAFVSAEDQRFYGHNGFDWQAIEAAVAANQAGGKVRGASTISQQVARNAFLWQRRSWIRKGLETWYTVWLELLVPKDRILEVYLNIAQTGPCTFGVEAGARRWFEVPAAKLRPRQAAQLAAVLPAPARWTPKSSHVHKRADWILRHPAPMTVEGARAHRLPGLKAPNR